METYNGHVRTPADAIILFEACRLGLLPRVQRRLSEKERQLIKPGSVFVWDEREAGMRRWTDGKSWSASRVSGSFLTYREMEGRRGGNTFLPPNQPQPRSPRPSDSSNGSDDRSCSGDADAGCGEAADGYRYKPDGLMKQSFSITTSTGQHLHLISYSSRNPASQNLLQPTTDPQLRHIRPAKGMYPESTVHDASNMAATTRSPMAGGSMAGSPYGSSPKHSHYLRHSPHSQGTPMSYGYPPSPMHTPPVGYTYQHHPLNGLPPPMAVNQSPVFYGQPNYAGPGKPPGPTAFDRVPPPIAQHNWPPPPPPPYAAGYPHYAYPQPQPHSVPQGQSGSELPPPPPPPQGYYFQGHPTDPRYQSQPQIPAYHFQQQPPPQTPNSQPTPPSANGHSPKSSQEKNTNSSGSAASTASAAPSKIIPSISSMINHNDSPTPYSPQQRSPANQHRSSTTIQAADAQRTTPPSSHSHSPLSNVSAPATETHATTGLGNGVASAGKSLNCRGEDANALRRLDRAFAA